MSAPSPASRYLRDLCSEMILLQTTIEVLTVRRFYTLFIDYVIVVKWVRPFVFYIMTCGVC